MYYARNSMLLDGQAERRKLNVCMSESPSQLNFSGWARWAAIKPDMVPGQPFKLQQYLDSGQQVRNNRRRLHDGCYNKILFIITFPSDGQRVTAQISLVPPRAVTPPGACSLKSQLSLHSRRCYSSLRLALRLQRFLLQSAASRRRVRGLPSVSKNCRPIFCVQRLSLIHCTRIEWHVL
jgi:hypothetical protein